MHLRSVLKETPLWEAIVEAVGSGGVVAGSMAGAMVLTDPMVDPRGGAFTLGLGLVRGLAVIPSRRPVVARAAAPHEGAVTRVPAGGAADGVGPGARATGLDGRHGEVTFGSRRGGRQR